MSAFRSLPFFALQRGISQRFLLFTSFCLALHGQGGLAAATVALNASPNPAVFGHPVTLTATVTGATGSVVFYDGASILGGGSLSAGTATLTTALLSAGNHSLRAYYPGDAQHGPGTSSPTGVTVNAVPANVLEFGGQVQSLLGNTFHSVVADFNGDGKADLAVGGFDTFTVELGNGDGSFQALQATYAGNPTSYPLLVAGDFNGDGKTDIASASYESNTISIFLGNGDGTFQTPSFYVAGTGPTSFLAGDFNADGKLDLMVANNTSNLTLLLGNGDGTFQPGNTISGPSGSTISSIAQGDFNQDGKPDLALAVNPNTLAILLANGDGTFQTLLQPPFEFNQPPLSIVAADFNADGKPDLAVSAGSVYIFTGKGDGTFFTPVAYPARAAGFNMAAADFNGDGNTDLAVVGPLSAELDVLLGNGNGTFQLPQAYQRSSHIGLGPLAVGDFNGDGRADLALMEIGAPSSFGSVYDDLAILLGTPATMSATMGTPQSASIGAIFSAPLQITIHDSNGGAVQGVAVVFSSPSAGPGAQLSASTVVSANTGTASVSAIANSVTGSYLVTATAGGMAATFSLNNYVGTPATIEPVTLSPLSAATGMPFLTPIAVIVKDANGNCLNGVTVTFAAPATGASAVLSNGTAITNSSGVASIFATANGLTGQYNVIATISTSAGPAQASYTLSNVPATPVVLSASANPSVFGAAVTLTAAVTPPTAAGKVTFYDGAVVLGTNTVVNGSASLPTIALPAGNRRLLAYYSGDGNNAASNSNVLAQGVNAVAGTGFFKRTPTLGVPGAFDAVVADFNGDGKADIAAIMNAGSSNSSIAIQLGNGDGTFRNGGNYPMGSPLQPWHLAVGDFNGDGNIDLSVDDILGTIVILLGNGNGTFQTPVQNPIGGAVALVNAVADLNRDGNADIVVLHGDGTLSVLLGKGDGTFGNPFTLPGSLQNANALALGDFNGDGKPDLAIAGIQNSNVSILLGNGDGTFQQPITSSAGTGGGYLLAADLNNDGKSDLVLANSGVAVSILLGNGDGTFQIAATYSVGAPQIGGVTLADFNGDGAADIALSDVGNNRLLVLQGNGDGTFSLTTGYAGLPAPGVLVAGDFNRDGRADLGVNSSFSNITILIGVPASLSIASHHTGNFTQGQNGATYSVTVSDASSAGPSAGVVTVTETAPAGLNLVSMSGTGWTCPSAGATCTRSDALVPGASYPAITVTVNVAGDAASPQVNSVSVSGGGAATASGNDSTVIIALPLLSISKTHAGNFTQGQSGTYTVTVSNGALAGPTTGAVTVTENVPSGETLLLMSGTGWTCPTGGNTCTRNDVLNPGASYPAIAVDVRVAANASSLVTNSVSLSGGATANDPTIVNPAVALRFVPIMPCRVADTRKFTGGFGPPRIAGGSTRDFIIPNSSCGVPNTAQAYALNVAVVPAGSLGFLTLWPTGQAQPVAATLNSVDGRIKSNAAIVPAGANGGISVFASNATDLILDINGYFVPATNSSALAFYPVTPCRIADTRKAAAPALSAGKGRTFAILSSGCGIPPTAQAYSLNFAVVPPGPLGYITAYPTGQSQPQVSSLNAPTGTVTANAAIVPAGTNGSIDVFASNNTNLVIDIDGYFAPMTAGGLSLYAVAPCRVLDTRKPAGTSPFNGELDVNVAGSACGIPLGAQADVFSATVAPQTALGYLTLWAQGQAQPVVATLNAVDGAIASNLAIVPTTNGSISAWSTNPTHLILDIFGYFAQ